MNVPEERGPDAEVVTPDRVLIAAFRDGDRRAFSILWTRHSGIARRFARSLTQAFDADDLVSEAFARILTAFREGKGPTEAFRPYLLTTVRNVAVSWARKNREDASEAVEKVVDPRAADADLFATVDAELLLRAFRTLPERWQEVLWLTEVEALAPQEIAARLKLSANSVAALAYRAREGLRQAWVQAHVETDGVSPPHLWVLQRVGQRARGGLSPRNAARFDAHVSECGSCRLLAARAVDTSRRFMPLLLPLAVGIITAAGIVGIVRHLGTSAAYAADVAPILSTLPAARDRRSRLIVGLSAAVAVLIAAGASTAVNSSPPLSEAAPASVSPLPLPAETPTPSLTSPAGDASRTPTPTPPLGQQEPRPDEDAPAKSPPPSTHVAPPSRVTAAVIASSAARLVLNEVDTGGGVLLPVVSGTARPGAPVTVSLGARTETVVASSDGSWRTPEITVVAGTYDVSAAADGTIAHQSVSVTAPVLSVERRADAVTVIVHGMSTTRYDVSLPGDRRTVTTDDDPTTAAVFSADSASGETVTVCARAGERSGPPTSIDVP